ncbi:hypothetical protein EHM69_01575 [candidate division KSB1 bacterium]|nr:MAG: hypothetical protein EHM69_01575 [candidate division KSB1 bacterium]
MNPDSPDLAMMALGIGLIAVIGSFAVILVIVMTAFRNRRLRMEALHKERMLAIEKGLHTPEEFGDLPQKRRPFVAGLVWAAVGLGFILWGTVTGEHETSGIGMIPLLVGAALFIGDWISTRRHPRHGNSGLYRARDDDRLPDNPS